MHTRVQVCQEERAPPGSLPDSAPGYSTQHGMASALPHRLDPQPDTFGKKWGMTWEGDRQTVLADVLTPEWWPAGWLPS